MCVFVFIQICPFFIIQRKRREQETQILRHIFRKHSKKQQRLDVNISCLKQQVNAIIFLSAFEFLPVVSGSRLLVCFNDSRIYKTINGWCLELFGNIFLETKLPFWRVILRMRIGNICWDEGRKIFQCHAHGMRRYIKEIISKPKYIIFATSDNFCVIIVIYMLVSFKTVIKNLILYVK